MVVHAVYDAGAHHMKTTNRPAFYWVMAEAFGNFIGGRRVGLHDDLAADQSVHPRHAMDRVARPFRVLGRLWLRRHRGDLPGAAEGHEAAQDWRATPWKWSFALLNIGMVGMVGALLVSGIAQAFYERAMGGSTLQAFIAAQSNVWFVQGMYARLVFGLVFSAGYVVLVYDLLTIGRRRSEVDVETRAAAAGS